MKGGRESRGLKDLRCDELRAERSKLRFVKLPGPGFQEKPPKLRYYAAVPQTDTGGRVEDTKALGRNPGEGTRQKCTVTSGEGTLSGVKSARREHLTAAAKWRLGLFNKNTALCEPERGSIGV